MLQTEPANIFRGAPNDYNVRLAKCKKSNSDLFMIQVARIISEETGYNPLAMVRYRGRKFVEARQMMAVFLSRYTKGTQEIIGRTISKDHATIVHCKTAISNLLDTDKVFRETFGRIEKRVKLLIK